MTELKRSNVPVRRPYNMKWKRAPNWSFRNADMRKIRRDMNSWCRRSQVIVEMRTKNLLKNALKDEDLPRSMTRDLMILACSVIKRTKGKWRSTSRRSSTRSLRGPKTAFYDCMLAWTWQRNSSKKPRSYSIRRWKIQDRGLHRLIGSSRSKKKPTVAPWAKSRRSARINLIFNRETIANLRKWLTIRCKGIVKKYSTNTTPSNKNLKTLHRARPSLSAIIVIKMLKGSTREIRVWSGPKRNETPSWGRKDFAMRIKSPPVRPFSTTFQWSTSRRRKWQNCVKWIQSWTWSVSARGSKNHKTFGWRKSLSRMLSIRRRAWLLPNWSIQRNLWARVSKLTLFIRAGPLRSWKQRSQTRFSYKSARRKSMSSTSTKRPRPTRSLRTFKPCLAWWTRMASYQRRLRLVALRRQQVRQVIEIASRRG